jgi:hypothetical protein
LHRFVAPVHDTVNIRKESKDDEIPFLLYNEQAKLLRTIYLFIFGVFSLKKETKAQSFWHIMMGAVPRDHHKELSSRLPAF